MLVKEKVEIELSGDGRAMSGVDTIKFFEKIGELLPQECQQEYGYAMNRIRYEISKSVPRTPKVVKAMSRGYSDFYNCGKCGTQLGRGSEKYCFNCGTAISWKSV